MRPTRKTVIARRHCLSRPGLCWTVPGVRGYDNGDREQYEQAGCCNGHRSPDREAGGSPPRDRGVGALTRSGLLQGLWCAKTTFKSETSPHIFRLLGPPLPSPTSATVPAVDLRSSLASISLPSELTDRLRHTRQRSDEVKEAADNRAVGFGCKRRVQVYNSCLRPTCTPRASSYTTPFPREFALAYGSQFGTTGSSERSFRRSSRHKPTALSRTRSHSATPIRASIRIPVNPGTLC